MVDERAVQERVRRLEETIVAIENHVTALDSRIRVVERQPRVDAQRQIRAGAGRLFAPAHTDRRRVEVTTYPLATEAQPHPLATEAQPHPLATEAQPHPLATEAQLPTAGATEPRSRTAEDAAKVPLEARSSTPKVPLADLVGGRWLAWIGGIATLLGIVLFAAFAISHGWIGEALRVELAAVAAAALIGGGAWLHRSGGRTEAAVAMVGAGTAAMFATLVIATELYALIAPLLAVGGAIGAGGLATTLAVRWRARALAVLGLLGAIISPILVGAPRSGATIAILAVATAAAMAVVVWQRWEWLGVAALLLGVPQWTAWLSDGHSTLAELAVLLTFGALGLAGALGGQLTAAGRRILPPSAMLVTLNACVVALAGRLALGAAGEETIGEIWLAGWATVHAVAGLVKTARFSLAADMRRLLVALGLTLVDVAFGLAVHGLPLAIGWGAGAVVFSLLSRRTRERDAAILSLGAGAHIALVLMRVAIDAPPSRLGDTDPQLLPLLTIAVLAASCFGAGRFAGEPRWREVLHAGGLAAIAYLTAVSLNGPVLVAAWAGEALALAQLERRRHGLATELGALVFLALAALHTIAIEAPPSALIEGVDDLPAAAIALAATSVAAARMAALRDRGDRLRPLLAGLGAISALYLPSIAIVTAYRPASDQLIDLGIAQQGQVLLSAMWSVTGLGALVLGLRRRLPTLRNAALALLLTAVGKVFLYDLSTLTSIYRVLSFVVLGLFLLAGAFAYQRLRPPPVPDMRSVHRSQR